MCLPWAASHLAFAFGYLKQNDKTAHLLWIQHYSICIKSSVLLRLPLGCLCPWIVRLNILGCRRSGYISGLLKFCVSASFQQFRDIKYFHFVFSCSLYIYVLTYVYSYLWFTFYSAIAIYFDRSFHLLQQRCVLILLITV